MTTALGANSMFSRSQAVLGALVERAVGAGPAVAVAHVDEQVRAVGVALDALRSGGGVEDARHGHASRLRGVGDGSRVAEVALGEAVDRPTHDDRTLGRLCLGTADEAEGGAGQQHGHEGRQQQADAQ
jgi:hypothetical protein